MQPARPKVLVVDDVPANIHLMFEALGADHELVFATSGSKAIAIASEQQPDLILLDVRMPGMDGYEVWKRLKASDDTRDIPVIFVTALDEEVDEIRGFACGAVDYLVKPIAVPTAKARIKAQIELKRARDLLGRQAHLDSLTGLPNRRGFDTAIEREWRRALRNHKPLALAMVDIDNFKAYNDCYGHPAGDACLQNVARALSQWLRRPGDLTARYGGEEFACIVSDADLTTASTLAERARKQVEDLHIAHASSSHGVVTVSMGVAACVPEPGGNWRGLLEAADDRLYSAKAAGRNSVSPPPSH